MSVRLLALDIDGTLLRSDKSLSVRVRGSVDAARARGVRVVLVTGRRYPSARVVAEQLGGAVDLVVHNGALIVEEGQVVRCRPLARRTAGEAIRFARQRRLPPVVHCGSAGEGRLLVEEGAPRDSLVARYLNRSRPDVTVVSDVLEALDEDPIEVMLGGPREQIEELLPPLRATLGPEARIERTVYRESGVGIVDILDPTVGKHEGIDFLRRRWGLAREQTLAIGDNWNDQEMLARAGRGLLMGNADPELLRLGLPVLPSNDEDGAAIGIETYVLAAVGEEEKRG